MGRSYYDVLGITPTASLTLIRAAYKARIREAHPDAGGSEAEAALVNEAYDVLSDEHARFAYDQTVDQSAATPAGGASYSPSTPPPSYATAESRPTEPEHFRPTDAARTPLWRRGTTAKTLLIAGALWLVAAITLGLLSAARADIFDIPQPGVAGFLTAALPAAIIALILTRAKLWLTGAAVLGYGIFCASQSVSGYGSLMLIVTAAASLAMRIALRAARKDAALEVVGDFWAACAHPDLSGWFIARSMQDRQTCLVQLVDVSGEGRPDTSAMLWGNHAPGTYVIADMSSSPATVLMTVTAAEMTLAKKSRK